MLKGRIVRKQDRGSDMSMAITLFIVLFGFAFLFMAES